MNLKYIIGLATITLLSMALTACNGSTPASYNPKTSPNNDVLPLPNNGTSYALTVSNSGRGNVTSSPTGISCGSSCSNSFTTGATVTLTAVANTGYSFTGWSGACSGTGTCTIVMSTTRRVNADFAIISAGGNAITLSLVSARTSGVAPLSVFFDASGTIDPGVTSRPFHDIEYRWSFGDASAGNWANGARPGVSSKNAATGPVAAHVFETPGTYTVSVSAFDGTNSATTQTTITVLDPDTVFAGSNTICFSTSATYTGCPAGATQVQISNFTTAINTYQATTRRLLFRRGESFTANTSATINKTGPGIVGAFDTGAKPIVTMTGAQNILNLSSDITPTISDWRVMDLNLDGGVASCTGCTGISGGGGINQVTILRVDVRNIYDAFIFSDQLLDWWNTHGSPGHAMWDQFALVDSSVNHVVKDGEGSFISARRFFFAGNLYDDALLAQHVLRLPYIYKGAVSNNTLGRAALTKLVLKMHGPLWTNGIAPNNVQTGGYTDMVIVSDNKFINSADNPWTVAIQPENAESDERLRNIIVERNWFYSGNSKQQVALLMSAVEGTIRNNICDMTGALYHECIHVGRLGTEPVPNSIRVYNNTIYSGSSGDFIGVSIGVATNASVINNLGSAPSATSPDLLSGSGTSGLVQSNNLLNNTPSALFVSAAPATPADFALKTHPNPARETGLPTVPVFSDLFGTGRPQHGVIDVGAVEEP